MEIKKISGNNLGVFEVIGIVLLICISWVYSSYCLELYVRWFLNPIFNIKLINLSEAICLVLVFGFLTRSFKLKDDEDTPHFAILYERMVGTTIYLLLGYLFYRFLM